MGFRLEDPHGHLVGDIIPFFDRDTKLYHIFYLRGHPDGTGLARFDTSWAHCATSDWKEINVLPDALHKGLRGAYDDGACFTGCLVKHDGTIFLFYTAFSPYWDSTRETICLATSMDGVTFRKYPHNPILIPDGLRYGASGDFRDPFVWFDDKDGIWRMVFASGLMGERCATRRGAVAQAESRDLLHWDLLEPLYAPRIYPSMECPEVFQIGPYYYLLFSQYGRTEYRMADTPQGPWRIPERPCFDCGEYFFYAAKTLFDGKRRFLLGWCGQLQGEHDAHNALWGGLMVTPREIRSDAHGELFLTCPKEWTTTDSPQCLDFWNVFTGLTIHASEIELGSDERFDAALVMDSDCVDYCLTADADTIQGKGIFGVILRSNGNLEQNYILEVNRSNRMMYFKRYRSYSLFSGDTVNMDVILAEKSLGEWTGVLTFSIHFNRNVMEAFVNRSVMTIPVAELRHGMVGFFAGYNKTVFQNIRFNRVFS